jgi:hypothetical protein
MKTSTSQPFEQLEERILSALYRYLPLSLIQAVERLARYLLPFLHWRINIYELQGKGANGEGNLVALCVGERRWARYIPERIYSKEPTRRKVTTVFPWNLPRKLASLSPHADLIIVRTDIVSGELLFSEDYIAVPEWVASILPVPKSLTELSKASHSVKSDVRKIRKRAFSPVISHESDDLETFYETMYVPYITQRYGPLAKVRPFDRLKRRFDKRGGLLFVEWKGQHIAGALYNIDGDTFSFLFIGVKDGDFGYVQMGAIAALYYFRISLAGELGCKQIYLGGSRSFLDDGVFQYKRKWGMKVEEKKDNFYDFILEVCNDNSETRAFLAGNPFILRDGKGFSGLIFFDCDHPVRLDEVRRLHKHYWTPGLQKLYFLSPSDFEERVDHMDLTLPQGTVLVAAATAQRKQPRVVGTPADTIPKAVLSLVDGRSDSSFLHVDRGTLQKVQEMR